jgi:hypothetical protein
VSYRGSLLSTESRAIPRIGQMSVNYPCQSFGMITHCISNNCLSALRARRCRTGRRQLAVRRGGPGEHKPTNIYRVRIIRQGDGSRGIFGHRLGVLSSTLLPIKRRCRAQPFAAISPKPAATQPPQSASSRQPRMDELDQDEVCPYWARLFYDEYARAGVEPLNKRKTP